MLFGLWRRVVSLAIYPHLPIFIYKILSYSNMLIWYTSAHWTLAIYPLFCNSIQLASYNFGPIKKLRSAILSSSLTSVAVRPSFVWAFTIVSTLLNILAGMVCTSVKTYKYLVSCILELNCYINCTCTKCKIKKIFFLLPLQLQRLSVLSFP